MQVTDLLLVAGLICDIKDSLPYTPALALNVFHLIGPVEKYLDDKCFTTDADVKQAVAS
jgi:hypothetical protein